VSEYLITFSYPIKSNKNRPHTLKENVRVLDQHVKIQEAKVMDIT